jgi:RNA polymerase sigma factor (sigma-70 family)
LTRFFGISRTQISLRTQYHITENKFGARGVPIADGEAQIMNTRIVSRGALYHHLETLFGEGTSVGSTEGELLNRFVNERDAAAFEALVARHGPMVLGVCRQVLRDPNDVDDAFQATFLVLVRKASTLRRCDLLGNWLYGVAFRVAARARSQSARRLALVTSQPDVDGSLNASEYRQAVGTDSSILMDQGPVLHKEVNGLPEKYRVPIVLCYFEGLTHDEAALRLGWPLGTVKGRLARARDLLRRRLTSRGVTLSATALTAQLAVFEAKAAVPAALQRITLTLTGTQALAHELGASLAASSAASLSVYALAEGVLQTMIANQVKTVALPLLLIAGTVATGVGVAATRLSGDPANGESAPQRSATSSASAKSSSSEPGVSATVGKTESAAASISPVLVQNLSAETITFSNLLSRFRNPEIEDINRLYNWSCKTLEADQALATTDADRRAAYEGHRDRMKRLVEFTEKIPVSDTHQSVKADHARNLLQQAEEGLKNIRQAPGAAGAMGRMMSMMGGATGSTVRMGAMPASGVGRMAMMGSGGSSVGTMGAMAANGASPAPGQPATKDSAQPVSKAAPATDQTPTKTASTPEPAASARRGQAAVGGMAGFGGGMGGGMGGMGGGMGGMGGMGGGMGGMGGGQMSPEAVNRRLRSSIATTSAELAARETHPQSKAILKKLEMAISMPFSGDNTLEEVLKYIQQTTAANNDSGIPIYVDPKGLKEAEATLQSRINLDLQGVPLKTTFRLALKQIGLAYCVRDGVLIVSSAQGIHEELMEAVSELQGADAPAGGGLGGGGGFR